MRNRTVRFVPRLALMASIAMLAVSPTRAETIDPATVDALVARGITLRQQGSLLRSADVLEAALTANGTTPSRTGIAGELGITQLQARQFDAAQASLERAFDESRGTDRARFAIYLGNLALARGNAIQARHWYEMALGAAPGDVRVELGVGLNLARLAKAPARMQQLTALSQQLAAASGQADATSPNAALWIAFHINLGEQARQLAVAEPAGAVQKQAFARATDQLILARRLSQREVARTSGATSAVLLALEATDALAQLHEDQGQMEDARALTNEALPTLNQVIQRDPHAAAELQTALQWRRARLLAAAGDYREALAAYEVLAAHIERIRQDMPINSADGRSTFHVTLEPIYLGFADLMLQNLGTLQPEELQVRLRQIRNVVEQIKQTELQDFMGDRCAVEAVQGGGVGHVAAGTAVLYPVIFPTRLEMVLETQQGLTHFSVPVAADHLRRTAGDLAASLRGEQADVMPAARLLYKWLIAPLQPSLEAQKVHTLVLVPDGVLRMVPLAILHDGRQFMLERYATPMVTGMSMTNTQTPRKGRIDALVAGVSIPGPVLQNMSAAISAAELRRAEVAPASGNAEVRRFAQTFERGAHATRSAGTPGALTALSTEELRERLALPGVEAEVRALHDILDSEVLLNAGFTVAHFKQEAGSGDYRVLHIASHGMFGGSAETSFIMAYDDLLSVNSLQELLHGERYQSHPLELLSLSACETAEGNDRAPLGMSGAAIKARAKSVVGTLWPVDDRAAREVMTQFYRGLASGLLSKSEALRQAQLALLQNPVTSDPFYWAPFVLIGNWQ